MKILLCTTSFRNITNGPTKFANFLYRNGKGENGLEVHILTEDIWEEDSRLYKCHIGFLRKILPLAPIYRMIKYYSKSKQLNKIYDFDYVIYNNAVYGLIHAFFKNNIVGMINDYNNQENISTRSVLNYGYIKKRIFKYFEKTAIKYSHLILTNSDFLNKQLKNSYRKYAPKMIRLYKGVEFRESLQKNDCSWNVEDLDNIKILFVKNDFITGGIRILAESLETFDLQFNVTIIGPDLKYADEIISYFKTPNITLDFIGRQSQSNVFNYMATHHIFCVPSLQEALGVANLEALNVGIPVVSSDAGGIPEALDYGNCGFLSEAGNTHSLAVSLKDCLYNKCGRKKKVLNGFEYVKKFKADSILKNLQQILDGSL
ncbi:MAG: glycosyltransferase family 4 protein [Ginsengibacter sp.]